MQKKLGVALSGGASKGFAHIGVLKVFEENNIPIDYICGTSIGSFMGEHYSLYKDIDLLTQDAFAFIKENKLNLYDLLKPGYEKILYKIELYIDSLFGGRRFNDTIIPFSCIASDIETGEQVNISKGPLKDAVMASMSIPGLFPVKFYWGSWLVDGGLLNNLPLSVLKEKKIDILIGVDLGDYETKPKKKKPSRLDALRRSLYVVFNDQRKRAIKENPDAIIVAPKIRTSVMKFNLYDAKKAIREGEKAAIKKIDEIKKVL